jgi:hypothetical protein
MEYRVLSMAAVATVMPLRRRLSGQGGFLGVEALFFIMIFNERYVKQK